MLTLSSLSSPLYQVPVSQRTLSGIGNPTGDTVSLAFLNTTRDPVSGDWQAGSWFTSAAGTYYAQCKIGPLGFPLAKGYYYVWVQIVDPVETIVACVGEVEIA